MSVSPKSDNQDVFFEYQNVRFSRIGQLQVKVGCLNDRFWRIGQPWVCFGVPVIRFW